MHTSAHAKIVPITLMLNHLLWYSGDYRAVESLQQSMFLQVVRCNLQILRLQNVKRVSNKLFASYVSWSVNTCVCIPHCMVKVHIMLDTQCNTVVLDVHTTLVNFNLRSVINSNNCSPSIMFRSGLRMYISRNSNGILPKIIVWGVYES